MAFPLEFVVGSPLHGRCLSRRVASRDHPCRASCSRAIPEVDVSGNRKNGVRNPRIPRNIRVTRDVGSAVDVPEPTEMFVVTSFLSPSRVGNDMAVLSEKALNDLEDARVSNGPLDEAAPIEHLVSKRRGFLGRISSLVWGIFLVDPLDIGAESRELLSGEDAIQNDVSIRLEALHRRKWCVRAEREISGRPCEHAPILPPKAAGASPPGRRAAPGRIPAPRGGEIRSRHAEGLQGPHMNDGHSGYLSKRTPP